MPCPNCDEYGMCLGRCFEEPTVQKQQGDIVQFRAKNKKKRVTIKTGVLESVSDGVYKIRSGRKTFEVGSKDVLA